MMISAVAFDLMVEASQRGGFTSTALGFLARAAAFTVANISTGLLAACEIFKNRRKEVLIIETAGALPI